MAENSEGSAKKRRRGPGRPFRKGQSGNPGGRKPLPAEYGPAFDVMEPMGYQALAEILADPTHKDREKAAEYVINRRRGKPTERTEVSGPSGSPLISPTASAALLALRRLVGDDQPPPAPPAVPPEGDKAPGEG